ncbi:MAG: hypothetical protein M4579_007614 [Chaenotheca gracillima]|nr:MAG: hypothetical protein M4579_007614 [Chaenotheca gracillima]
MATCHSLRVVDDELVGDPLDLKMFEFTGWSFDEGETKKASFSDEEDQSKLTPAVARPPAGMEFDPDQENGTKNPIDLGILKSFDFVSQLRRASVVVRQFGTTGADVYFRPITKTSSRTTLIEDSAS